MPSTLVIEVYRQGAVDTKDFQVTIQKGHPRPEGLKASIAAAQYIANGRDMPRKKASRSLDIRAQGENGTI